MCNAPFRIRGNIQRLAGPETVSFELLRGDNRAEPSRAALDINTGNFQVLDVTPGDYKLRASQGMTRGEVMVNVGSDDISGVSIVLLPPVALHGMIRRPSSGAAGPTPCQITLQEPGSQDSLHISNPLDTGQFNMADVFPGEYQFRPRCFGGYPQSASFGNSDLLANPVLTVSSSAPLPIELNYTPGGGTLKVKFEDQVPPRGAVLHILSRRQDARGGPTRAPPGWAGAGRLQIATGRGGPICSLCVQLAMAPWRCIQSGSAEWRRWSEQSTRPSSS